MQTIERKTPINLDSRSFRQIGHAMVDRLALLLEELPSKQVTTGESSSEIRGFLGSSSLPLEGTDPMKVMERAMTLLTEHSLYNGHPRFLGYITSAPAPLGALADLLASLVNPNVGAHVLSPMATEIERQTIQWLAEFIGYDPGCGGILVSGGNMANFTAFLAARTAMGSPDLKEKGLAEIDARYVVYCSRSTHTWIEKAANLFGLGLNAVRWIETDEVNRVRVDLLEKQISEDEKKGFTPLMVVATGGDVSTGAVDNLDAVADVCKEHEIWFHIDGAYGVPAVVVPECADLFKGLQRADSVALDPHKWLYCPLEAGCILVKDRKTLIDTFTSHPDYYHFDDEDRSAQNFYELGLQNSRGFRSLKVWMVIQQVGKQGYEEMIRQDIELSRFLFELAEKHPKLQAVSQSLSISTFRFVPDDLSLQEEEREEYLNSLNRELLDRIQKEGQCFLSNAVVGGKYCLRGCVVNFRTSHRDMGDIVDLVVQMGNTLHKKMREI